MTNKEYRCRFPNCAKTYKTTSGRAHHERTIHGSLYSAQDLFKDDIYIGEDGIAKIRKYPHRDEEGNLIKHEAGINDKIDYKTHTIKDGKLESSNDKQQEVKIQEVSFVAKEKLDKKKDDSEKNFECKECGHEFNEKTKFCPGCGVEFE